MDRTIQSLMLWGILQSCMCLTPIFKPYVFHSIHTIYCVQNTMYRESYFEYWYRTWWNNAKCQSLWISGFLYWSRMFPIKIDWHWSLVRNIEINTRNLITHRLTLIGIHIDPSSLVDSTFINMINRLLKLECNYC